MAVRIPDSTHSPVCVCVCVCVSVCILYLYKYTIYTCVFALFSLFSRFHRLLSLCCFTVSVYIISSINQQRILLLSPSFSLSLSPFISCLFLSLALSLSLWSLYTSVLAYLRQQGIEKANDDFPERRFRRQRLCFQRRAEARAQQILRHTSHHFHKY